MDSTDASPFRILVVDDEPHILQILRFTLEKAGYQVSVAEDGEKALRQLDESPPDLVILDIMMPKMTGYEVCRKMREAYKTSHIPVILLTAKGELSEKIKGLEGGANDYLVNPTPTRSFCSGYETFWIGMSSNAKPIRSRVSPATRRSSASSRGASIRASRSRFSTST